MVVVLISNLMFTDFGKKTLLANWLPWQQLSVYF